MNEKLSRKTFLKASAIGTIGVATMGLAACASSDAAETSTSETDILQLQDRLWVLEAKEEIRYKLCLYCRGDDRQDAEEGKKMFAEDSYVDFGTNPDTGPVFKGTGWDWVDKCVNVTDKGITAAGGFYAHFMGNIAITVNGKKAGSETYVTAPVMFPNGDGTYTLIQGVARYCDKWEYRNGEWLVIERHVTNDYGYYLQSSALLKPYDGSFDKNDPSYAALAYGK
ncbi:nuclear transport factor 2 family protein [Trichlorobacter lovleyi]|uniref:Gamma-BHC dehydrochlorinase n=1 Tax=Trichlorobacter lovleyi (strain ATCC BAA-1151 / DSM 17278 / SZ) TaxID=398767 RepID=B3E7N6_TRIL1|nr:nuclear transport factor 2 family protein [Trichlorobacter lovleyi]ACD95018.1 gamma-BHC dehydrochlorinase [Trichlorobacter lovleyi SZ]